MARLAFIREVLEDVRQRFEIIDHRVCTVFGFNQ